MHGTIIITKYDEDKTTALSEAKFELRQGDKLIKEGTTGLNGEKAGKLTFSNIPFGTYKLYETIAPKGYEISEQAGYDEIKKVVDCGTINITPSASNKIVPIEITNTKAKKAKIRIRKKDYITGEELSGVRFKIIKIEDNKEIVVKYDARPNSDITLDLGTYIVEETKPDKEYDLKLQKTRSEKIVLDENNKGKVIEVTMDNTEYSNLKIIKVDSRTKETLNGVGFQIYFIDQNGDKHYICKYLEIEGKPADIGFVKEGEETNEKTHYTFKTGGTYEIKKSNGINQMYNFEDGEIYLKNIPMKGYKDGKNTFINEDESYYIEEVSLPAELQNYYDIESEPKKIQLVSNSEGAFKWRIKEIAKKVYAIGDTRYWDIETIFGNLYDTMIDTTVDINPDINISESTKDLFIKMMGSGDKNLDIYGYIDHLYTSYYSLIKEPENSEKYINEILKQIGKTKEDMGIDKYEECVRELENKTSTVYIKENTQKYIGLSGYVWEDVQQEKNSVRNNLYDEGETKISGITVNLLKNGVVIASKITDEDGKYIFEPKGEYNGHKYVITIDEIESYSIEFEYNGLKYENVNLEKDNTGKLKENGSKAIEKAIDRTNFNSDYAIIAGGNEKDISNGITVGSSYDQSGNKTNDLYYKNEDYATSLIQNTGYTVDSAKDSIKGKGVKIVANTEEANFKFEFTAGLKAIENINLGIYKRQQVDLAITTDIDNVELTINGYEDTCHYNERSEYINDLLPDDKDYKENSAFSVEVKNKNTGKYKETTYVREIYDSYIAFTKSSDSNDSNRLRVYVTYKIIVKNESDLISKVSLKNYIDTRYESASIIASKCYYNGNSLDVNWTNEGQVSGMNVYETGLIDQYIDAGNSMTIYVTYEVNKEGILYLISNDETKPLKHTTEIKSYSTFDSNKNVYAGIDTDSAPDNIEYGNVSTYEDDTDSSPDLKLKRKQAKQISGLVFEDSTNAGMDLKTGEERIGDGVYTEGENVVENAKVELLNYSDNSIAKLYCIDPNGTDGIKIVDAQTITIGTGQYTLEGLVPGQYYIEYTYGTFEYNGESKTTVIKTTTGDVPVTTQNYKSTILDTKNYIAQPNKTFKDLFESSYDDIKANFDQIKDSNALWYWYQNTNKSSAVDDWGKREEINSALSEINYGNENQYLSGNSEDNLYIMKADTAIMDVAIEQYNHQQNESGSTSDSDTYQVTFGIVERPRQKVEVTKEIYNIKLTLANGQVLVDGNPRSDSLSFVTYPEGGNLKIEVDYEILEGATLEVAYEITLTNKSELDYNIEEYYKYGTNSIGASPVTMKINSVIDYMDENLKTTYTYDGDKGEWKLMSAKDLYDNGLIAENVYDNVKNYNNILVNNCDLVLKPNESATLASVSASKLLSTANEMNYKNYVEILTESNDVGRFYGQEDAESITKWKLISPGSLVTTDATTYEVDDNKVGLNIIPPTGDNRNTVIYTVIGISCLSLLVVGIVLIKKKVLD